jgi:ADP-ribosylglycohydrolase
MGNKSSQQQQQQASPSQHDLQQCFEAICDSSSTIEKRKEALTVLRGAYVPDTSRKPAYSQELSRVFALRYPRWKEGQLGIIGKDNGKLVADSIKGIIFGAAVGDAAGLATEFLSKSQIDSYFSNDFKFCPGCEVYPDVHRVSFTAGDWTDDTDQLVLALISLLEGGGYLDSKTFARLLNDWREKGFPGLGDTGGCGLGKSTKSVITHEQFLTNPTQAARDIWERSGRKLAPNGALMRTSITAIPYYWDISIVKENTLQLCTTTHTDPRCQASCVYLCLIISRLLQYWSATTTAHQQSVPWFELLSILHTSYEEAEQILLTTSYAFEIFTTENTEAIEESKKEFRDYAHVDILQGKTIEQLQLDDGPTIGYTYKCLSVAIVALVQVAKLGRSFEDIMQLIIREGGDADTNAAVAGALVGAYLGITKIPTTWTGALPYEVWLDAWIQKILFMLQP